MAGMRIRCPPPLIRRLTLESEEPTSYSAAIWRAPSSMMEALAVVPPMSKVMTLSRFMRLASSWEAITPAAGPDSMM